MSRLFKIITLGCKVNQFESAALAGGLRDLGLNEAEPGQRADVVVVNTCAVTRRAAHQSRQAIRKVIRDNPGARVAAVGCYPQVGAEELQDIQGLHFMAGNRDKVRLAEQLLDLNGRPGRGIEPLGRGESFVRGFPKRFAQRARAYLKVQDGCESYCSYCIVPYARGPYRSLPPREVLESMEVLVREGYREIVLTGIHLGKYGVDLAAPTTLRDLLELIGRQGYPSRIRLSSLEPNEVDPGIIEMAAAEPWLCRHFHIPLQSGDDGVLRRMNRRYTRAAFERLILTLRERIPDAGIGVDVMAGFPGEDKRAHANSVELLQDLPVSYLHVFPFSPRPGTPAAAMDGQVPAATVKARAARLRGIGMDKKAAFSDTFLGRSLCVLLEAWQDGSRQRVMGTSDNYVKVTFPDPGGGFGRLVTVRLERRVGTDLYGVPRGFKAVCGESRLTPGRRGSPGHPGPGSPGPGGPREPG